MTASRILVVDDDPSVVSSLSLLLRHAGFVCDGAASPKQALARLDAGGVDLVLQDMNFSRQTSGQEGLDLLAQLVQRRPSLPVILITAWGSIELAVRGVKAGAADFVTKPWNNEHLLQSVRTALALAAAPAAPAAPLTRETLDEGHDFSAILGRDPKLLEILRIVGRVSATDAPVLITGESGTGKDLIAEAIHRNSGRRDGPLVKVNLGGISTSLFESEMFGHVRGAFTDAHADRQGRFVLADGGTIFLDEVGDLDPGCQVKLLRVLQERAFEALGSSQTRTVDIRVVSATNRDLPRRVAEGAFREDLLYRLNLIVLHLPPLRERPGDIALLAAHFARRLGPVDGAEVHIAPVALDWLRGQPWPGNIRQLKQAIERAALTRAAGAGALTIADFEAALASPGDAGPRLPAPGTMTLDQMEEAMVRKCLGAYPGNLTRAAEALGLSRAALYRRLEKYGIDS